ncbi:unnamed protein product, partial [Durusdinium trenchii]
CNPWRAPPFFSRGRRIVHTANLHPLLQEYLLKQELSLVGILPSPALLSHQLRAPNIDLAHAEKENGNTALRGHELGLAVACYTTGLALLPPEAVAAVPDGVAPEDEHALLRSVLFSNRASVFCRLKTWRSARADAQAAVEKKGDFVKARNRLGTALLACGQVEQAYVHFAHALKLESNNTAALKGRQACISILPLWRTLPARRRFRWPLSRDFTGSCGSCRMVLEEHGISSASSKREREGRRQGPL